MDHALSITATLNAITPQLDEEKRYLPDPEEYTGEHRESRRACDRVQDFEDDLDW
jgi:hypothetical protein